MRASDVLKLLKNPIGTIPISRPAGTGMPHNGRSLAESHCGIQGSPVAETGSQGIVSEGRGHLLVRTKNENFGGHAAVAFIVERNAVGADQRHVRRSFHFWSGQ